MVLLHQEQHPVHPGQQKYPQKDTLPKKTRSDLSERYAGTSIKTSVNSPQDSQTQEGPWKSHGKNWPGPTEPDSLLDKGKYLPLIPFVHTVISVKIRK